MNAADLARRRGTPTWLCPKDGAPMWYIPIASSSAHRCEKCGFLSFEPHRNCVPSVKDDE